ncbi:phosphate acyltransferase [Rubrobacter xylanophilus]|uniref:Phosphate acyltransferase n=1 Tax=Rubrobacter xylanophilus TaxID=49319 RepID=A0A510HFW0_9ACTN|nr:phosphate acyltransferase PlsX [Rubrobacter xylanophilus]BBL78836.1 phosphate acyltransferase [Rubrobacter xylanophilus]
MRIAVDALGGDNAPQEIVAGTLSAARRLPGANFVLVGEPGVIGPLLERAPRNVALQASGGAVRMDEEPATALRSRPDASVSVAARLLRSGEADALFSAGNTGATVAAALLHLGRIEGCRRPAIATVLPFSHPTLLLDVGATVACRAQDLLNFAILGSVFAKRYLETEGAPRVGLLNVGEEPGKGHDLAREAHRLIAESPQIAFVGNVEGRDLGSGKADVVVTDGFTGNAVLKTAEGVARECLRLVRDALYGSLVGRVAALAARPRLLAVRDQVDPENYGGSFLLGVRGPVVIGHGNSTARGVENALVGIVRAGGGLVYELEAVLSRRQTVREEGA